MITFPRQEFVVGDWRLILEPGHSLEDYKAAHSAAVAQAYERGELPFRQCGFLDPLEFAVPCEEVEEYGDLRIKSPIGDFVIAAQRARKGQPNGTVTCIYGGSFVGGGGVASEDSDSPPVAVHGRFLRRDDTFSFQVSSVIYADGTRSGYLGSKIFDFAPVSA